MLRGNARGFLRNPFVQQHSPFGLLLQGFALRNATNQLIQRLLRIENLAACSENAGAFVLAVCRKASCAPRFSVEKILRFLEAPLDRINVKFHILV